MSSVTDHIAESWPELLSYFASLTSAAAALRLATSYGGTTIYIPRARNLGEDHHLATALDFENAVVLCEEYGGEYIEIPMGPARRSKLKEVIRAFASEGKHSNRQIARMAGTTERHVRRTLNATDETDNNHNQGSLFT